MNNRILLYTSVALLFVSCSKDDSGPSTSTCSIDGFSSGVLILNEGNYGSQNASVSFFSSDGVRSENVFYCANKKNLGDVLNSSMETESNYYLVMNNSSKIEVVEKNKFSSIATITGFRSPRYMLDLENGKALVTNLTLDTAAEIEIDVVNLDDHKIEQSIKVTNACEMMVLSGQTAFVANTGKNQIVLIDKQTLKIAGYIPTPAQPSLMTKDKNGFIWVVCFGNYSDVLPSLVKIDPSTKSVLLTMEFPSPLFPTRITTDSKGENLYILADAVYKMPIESTAMALQGFLTTIGNGYGLGVNPENDYIYVADPKDYSSLGSVRVYDNLGNSINTIESGYIPSSFIFK